MIVNVSEMWEFCYFLGNHQTFLVWLYRFVPASGAGGVQFLHILTSTCYFLCWLVGWFLIIAILVGMKWYLTDFDLHSFSE